MKIIESKVKGFEGLCTPVWLNDTTFRRIHGNSGFFRLVKPLFTICGYTYLHKTGEEFHGIIENGVVNSTEGRVS